MDSSTPLTQVGIAVHDSWTYFEKSKEPPLESLFSLIEKGCKTTGYDLAQISKIIYCEGPGSILGIRLAVMAIIAWQKLYPTLEVYTFRNLELIAQQQKHTGKENAALVAPSYQKRWHYLDLDSFEASNPRILEVETDFLLNIDKELLYIPQRLGKTPPFPQKTLSYSIEDALSNFQEPLIQVVKKPTVFTHQAPEYKTWIGKRHY